MLTAVNDDETFLESIQAGADGYLTKDGPPRTWSRPSGPRTPARRCCPTP